MNLYEIVHYKYITRAEAERIINDVFHEKGINYTTTTKTITTTITRLVSKNNCIFNENNIASYSQAKKDFFVNGRG